MSHENCKYHPERAAAWYCEHCDIGFCLSCKPLEQGKPTQCTICRRRLVNMGVKHIATPFWHRMPAFFGYPFNWHTLWLTLTMVALLLLINVIPFLIIRIPLIIFTIGTYIHYFFVVLKKAASGHYQKPVPISEAFGSDSFKIFFSVLGLFLFTIASIKTMHSTFGPMIGTPFSLLVLLCLPASIMLLIADDSFWSAINPVKWLQLITTIGWPYLILFALLALTNLTASYVTDMLLGSLKGGYLLLLFGLLLQTYFSVQVFNMLGYVLYQYHHELGYHVSEHTVVENHAMPAKAGASAAPKHPALIELEILLTEGRLEDAKQTLLSALHHEQENLELMLALHKLAIALQDKANLAAYTEHALALIIQQRKPALAIDVLHKTWQLCPDYRVDEPTLALAIAQQAFDSRRFDWVVELLKGLHQRAPHFDKLPQAYLLVAKAYSEGLNNDKQALTVLQFIKTHYPQDPLIKEVSAYFELVSKMAHFSKA